MNALRPFTISTAQPVLDDITTKVHRYRWPKCIELRPGEDPWAYGANWNYLKQLCEYWLQGYDWRRAEARLNRFPQFIANVDGFDIHFIHEPGSGRKPQTLVLTHGWPGSFYEFNEVIEPLAHPERFGGDAEDGVNVVAPSLIGFGYSCKPSRPVGPARIAALWDKLMRNTLGDSEYVAQGGDWGSVVSAHLGYQHSVELGGGCRAIHVNMSVCCRASRRARRRSWNGAVRNKSCSTRKALTSISSIPSRRRWLSRSWTIPSDRLLGSSRDFIDGRTAAAAMAWTALRMLSARTSC